MSSILVVDDEKPMTQILSKILQEEGYQTAAASSGREALASAVKQPPDLVLLDLMLPDMDGIEILERLLKMNTNTLILIMTAYGKVGSAVQAIKLGATDYLLKPFNNDDLKKTIRNALVARTKDVTSSVKKIIGKSSPIMKVWKLIDKFAFSDLSMLLVGESGTGKELFARAIHDRSKRYDKPFFALDCATLPDTLVESEIFGHEKGAFTGAYDRRAGKFEAAHSGTIFLDEIGNLPLNIQAKLLRVIQERQIMRLGTNKPIKVDVRIISATNIDLKRAIKMGTFREDLYYRLNGIAIELPPLRKREEDIEELLAEFIGEYNKTFNKAVHLSEPARVCLKNYPWPGNVRELENAIKSAMLLTEDEIMLEHLPEYLLGLEQETAAKSGLSRLETGLWTEIERELETGLQAGELNLKSLSHKLVEEIEAIILKKVHDKSPMNQSQLAHFLQMDNKTLRVKLKKCGLSLNHKPSRRIVAGQRECIP
ncbi:MAG: sigma-54-dependent Fis family transcriptional regulator [Acidobacteria bacterium]|nr:sigma-54-dependent Fis family transcriptional regulator [Acidobacteriota bacterium]MBI3654846.1 sigma-54-dependent Fis family transcriptional regulator [Acidobacteriota bacterium]